MIRLISAAALAWGLLLTGGGSPLYGAPGDLPSSIVTHPELEVSLFAMEPDVVDPVAMCFDAQGRMYVVEMRDYPYGLQPGNRPGGTVRLLEDLNGDGRADRSVVFAEDLSFPTSIAAHRDGVIVTAPPEIVWLKDNDGDGRADVREVVYRGFRRGVTDGNMSGLRWGLDNWLHGVNGGHGGNVYSPRNPTDPVRLGNLDFRIRPDAGAIETTFSTGGGFGLVFDEWGRSFTPHNVNHLQMRFVMAGVLGRHPGLAPTSGTGSISDHGEMARIFAISEARTRPNHPEQAGYFSSAGGVGYIGHQGYPGDLAGSVTVCDVVGNLVHRDVLAEDGPVLRASRPAAEQTKEFIASTDPAFRPTGLELGPDGALYLMDMHRVVIEHPDYIPKKMLETMDLRAGDQQGRIYRILPTSGVRQNQSALAGMSPNELVEELASPNQWRRMTAQRLIVEQNHLIASVPLQQVVRSHVNPVARVHALWALAGIGELGESLLLAALEDADARVQENALQAAAVVPGAGAAVQDRVLALARNGPTPRVRFMALQGLDGRDVPAVRNAVATVLRTDGGHAWSRRVGLASLPGGENEILQSLLGDDDFLAREYSPMVVGELAELVGVRTGRGAVNGLGPLLSSMREGAANDAIKLALLNGLANGLARNPAASSASPEVAEALAAWSQTGNVGLARAVLALQKRLGLTLSPAQTAAMQQALATAADRARPAADRVAAVGWLELGDAAAARPVLLGCFSGAEPVELQRAALQGLRQATDLRVAEGLIEQWRNIHPVLKHDVAMLLVRQRDYHEPLLKALEDGRLTVGELNLDLEDRRRLLRWSSPAVQARAAQLLGDGEYGNRQAKVDQWLARLPASGNPARGRAVFEQACATCHRAGDLGHEVGPDLGGLAHRSVEDLVSNILDPNMAINPNYFSVALETVGGELVTGILAGETVDAVTLLQAGGIRRTLRRNEFARMESTGTSLMPEGLETGLTPGQLRDLVSFLQGR